VGLYVTCILLFIQSKVHYLNSFYVENIQVELENFWFVAHYAVWNGRMFLLISSSECLHISGA